MLKTNLISEDATLESTLKTEENASMEPMQQKPLTKLTRSKLVTDNIKSRDSEDFDPFDQGLAFHPHRTKLDKCFGYLKPDSMRTGAIGIITATLGTGVLALPNGIAHYGWVAGMATLLISGLCQYLSYVVLGYAQSLVSLPPSYPRC